MTEAAHNAWTQVYPTLSEGHSGLFGAVTARAEGIEIPEALYKELTTLAGKVCIEGRVPLPRAVGLASSIYCWRRG